MLSLFFGNESTFNSGILKLLPSLCFSLALIYGINLLFAKAFLCRHLFIIASDFRCISFGLTHFSYFQQIHFFNPALEMKTTTNRKKSLSWILLLHSCTNEEKKNAERDKKKTNPIFIDYACSFFFSSAF